MLQQNDQIILLQKQNSKHVIFLQQHNQPGFKKTGFFITGIL